MGKTLSEKDLVAEFIDLETTLTVFELLLLLKVAVNDQGLGPLEPIWTQLDGERPPITDVPLLSVETLLSLAQQQRLIRLGLLEMYMHETEGVLFRLTPKGQEAVNWWAGCLEDMGFRHAVLAAD